MGKLVRMISECGKVICYAAETADVVQKAHEVHDTSATVTAALGRLLTAGAIMGSMLPDENNSLTLRLAGDGPAGALIVVSDYEGNVRGYVSNPHADLPNNQYGKLDVGGVVGKNGTLSVIKDFGTGDPYVGQIPIVSGEVAEDITSYYATSEQVPTVCALGVLVDTDLSVKQAGGFLVQLLPDADEATISQLEKNINGMAPITKLLDSGKTIEEIARDTLEGFQPHLLLEAPCEYRCYCSKKRVENALISIGREELKKMAEEEEVTEVSCHFCNKKYRFSREEISALADR